MAPTKNGNENGNDTGAGTPRPRPRRRPGHAQALFSVAEAARILGQRPDALRRTLERHALAEGDELVARLAHDIVARKRKGLGRWSVHVPPSLLR